MSTVLITGVSRGIGKATAEKFLNEGWQVVGTSTSGEVSIKSSDLQVFKLDLFNPVSIEEFVNEVSQAGQKIDVLINNAAISIDDGRDLDTEMLRKTLELNVVGWADLTMKLLPLIKDGGSIVNISSRAGSLSQFGGAYAPAYQISKTAENGLTKVLSDELRSRRITVSSLCPGWVRTDMGGRGAPRSPEKPAEEIFNLATSDVESGNFWAEGKIIPW